MNLETEALWQMGKWVYKMFKVQAGSLCLRIGSKKSDQVSAKSQGRKPYLIHGWYHAAEEGKKHEGEEGCRGVLCTKSEHRLHLGATNESSQVQEGLSAIPRSFRDVSCYLNWFSTPWQILYKKPSWAIETNYLFLWPKQPERRLDSILRINWDA